MNIQDTYFYLKKYSWYRLSERMLVGSEVLIWILSKYL